MSRYGGPFFPILLNITVIIGFLWATQKLAGPPDDQEDLSNKESSWARINRSNQENLSTNSSSETIDESSWTLVEVENNPLTQEPNISKHLKIKFTVTRCSVEDIPYYKFELKTEQEGCRKYLFCEEQECEDIKAYLMHIQLNCKMPNKEPECQNAKPPFIRLEVVAVDVLPATMQTDVCQGILYCEDISFEQIPLTENRTDKLDWEDSWLTEEQVAAIENYLRRVRSTGANACKKLAGTLRDIALAALVSTSNNPKYHQQNPKGQK